MDSPDRRLTANDAARWRQDLAIVLRRYGYWGLDVDEGYGSLSSRLAVINPAHDNFTEYRKDRCAIFVERARNVNLPGLNIKDERGGQLHFFWRRRVFRRPAAVYHALLDHVSFEGEALVPIWQTAEGRTVLGWWNCGGIRHLLVGLRVTEELVRYTQGDPNRVTYTGNRNLWGAKHEQPAFLYEGHIVPGYEFEPWADRLGQTLANLLAQISDLPVVCPLPRGSKGAVMITGDDDQAWLTKYDEQLQLMGDFPITYMLLPHTNHTADSLARMPPNVEFGIHIDAVNEPSRYSEICALQTSAVRRLIGVRTARAVRNHGHLNHNYWGHLSAWEEAGLIFGLNIRGLDGTCPTGSYLPFRVRRLDGSWSSHVSLFSTFSDSMLQFQKWSERKQIRCISRFAAMIEKTYPGILVFNFHPQNVSGVRRVHEAVMKIGRRPGWLALGVESFVTWLDGVNGVRLIERDGRIVMTSPRPVHGLALRWPSGATQHLPEWMGEIIL